MGTNSTLIGDASVCRERAPIWLLQNINSMQFEIDLYIVLPKGSIFGACLNLTATNNGRSITKQRRSGLPNAMLSSSFFRGVTECQITGTRKQACLALSFQFRGHKMARQFLLEERVALREEEIQNLRSELTMLQHDYNLLLKSTKSAQDQLDILSQHCRSTGVYDVLLGRLARQRALMEPEPRKTPQSIVSDPRIYGGGSEVNRFDARTGMSFSFKLPRDLYMEVTA